MRKYQISYLRCQAYAAKCNRIFCVLPNIRFGFRFESIMKKRLHRLHTHIITITTSVITTIIDINVQELTTKHNESVKKIITYD